MREVQKEVGRQQIDVWFKAQIRAEARRIKDGRVFKGFSRGYSFARVRFAMGGGTLSGLFQGSCKSNIDSIQLSGQIETNYSDVFEDPASIIEKRYGRSDYDEAPDWLRRAAQFGGRPYKVVGRWTESFTDFMQV